MKSCFTLLLLLLIIGALALPAFGQLVSSPPFWKEIEAFKKRDRQSFPPEEGILFVGSSSIRLWKDLEQHFPDYAVINRGFGGSTLLDLQRYLPDIVLPYQPRQVVIYSGENDIAMNKINAQEVLARFKVVFDGIRQALPNANITFISIKPSPSRARFLPITTEANALIKAFLKDKPHTNFVDIYSLMLDKQGKPQPRLFVADSLHMNSAGYEIWARALAPYLTD